MSANLSLFDRAPMLRRHVVAPAGDVDGLRPYQREAVTRIGSELAGNRSTLLVMATGTGKTQTFGAVAKHWPGRVLVLAHRDELIDQARSRLSKMTGEFVGVEQAERSALGERIVIGSVQTMCREARLKAFPVDRFGLVVVDEAHHAVARTYRKIIDHFASAKLLGVTATPDRADESAMGQVFDTVAFTYDIQDGIRDAYLCPVVVQQVQVDAIDLSAVKTTAGDLNQGQLDAVMASEEALHGIARPTMELSGDRRTILFTTSVDNAHRLAEVLNRYRGGCARAVDGTTSFDTRRDLLRGHKAGEYQFLCNVGVLTEGYDDPAVACIAMARPTKSRALYAQCIGRGLRPFPGKADCLVLDFSGNSGRHKLVSGLDILAGKWPDEVVERAKADAKKSPAMRSDEALARAAAAIEAEKQAEIAKRARIKAKVDYKANIVDPFGVLGMSSEREHFPSGPLTPGQLDTLNKFRIDVPEGCSRVQASRLISNAIMRKAKGLATYRQVRALSKYGIPAQQMYMATAGRLMDAIAKNGWKPIAPAEVSRIVNAREVGEDG